MKSEIISSELTSIKQKYLNGHNLVYEIDGLGMALNDKNKFYCKDTDNFLSSALSDIEAAILALENRMTLNVSCFHSQQAVEKMLKACLIEKGGYTEKMLKNFEYRHNIHSLYLAAKKMNNCFTEEYSSFIDILNGINMNIRYERHNISNESAVNVYWSSLTICGLCASFILGSERRK